MHIRVPLLLATSMAVIHRFDIGGTRSNDPVGAETTGYDDTLREPIVYDDIAGDRTDSRTELAAIRVKCQWETLSFERLRQLDMGDAPVSNIVFVFHRKDLENKGLLDANRDVILKKGDRISAVERTGSPPGSIVKTLKPPGLFIFELRPRSQGFGPDGYDLELAIMSERREGST